MAKDRSFAAKVAKSQHSPDRRCPVCGEVQNTIKFVNTIKNDAKNSWRFVEKNVGLCKCTDKEIFG